jgi:AcrR family transcriptional regulator
MGQTRSTETGTRGSAEGWLLGAYKSLVESGIDAVRISPLSQRLKLSRTSFYWFFNDRDTLLAALLDRWRDKNTRNLIARAEAYAENICEAIFNVFDCWFDTQLFDARFEFAVRSWAQQSQDVRAEVNRADALRVEALKGLFLRFGYALPSADARARTVYLTQIGYISMGTKEDLATRMTRIPQYVEVFTGRAPRGRDVDRFFARHGHVPANGDRSV